MAKRPRNVEPQVGPGPKHGDELEENERAGEELEEGELEEGEEGEEEEEQRKPESVEERLARMEGEMTALRRENDRLSRQPKPQPPPVVEEEEEEFDEEELFKNPKAALAKMRESITKSVKKELGGEYRKDQNQQTFWTAFYSKHEDLKEDRDLVQATLNSNLARLADMPAETAADELADLTRKRILRYSGGKPLPKGKKALAEGANAPSPRKVKPEPDKIVTLADVIKARRQKRRDAASGKRKGSAA